MQLQATLIDYNRVFNTIQSLSDIEKDKAIKDGLRSATSVFLNAGRINLRNRLKKNRKTTGNLMKSIRTKLKRNKLGALVGFNGLGMHSHLVDRGTSNRGKTGIMPPNNFWTDAINQNQNKAIEKVYSGIERGMNKIIKRN